MAAATKRMRCNTQWCSAINCTNNRRNNPSLSFFRFPKDLERCKKWIVNVRRQDLNTKSTEQLYKSNVLCANHFELSQFMNPSKNKLIHCAVPTLFDVPNKPQKVTPSRPPPKQRCIVDLDQTSKAASPMHETPKKDKASTSTSLSPKKVVLHKKLHATRQQLYRLRKKNNKSEINKKVSLNEIKEILADHLKGNTLEFIMTQIKVASKSKHALRWSEANKSLALSIYHSSPKTYKLLQQLLKLPSVRTLKRSMSNLDLKPGFCTNILQALKVKVNAMTSNEKLCTLVFDELSIKEAVIYNKKHDVVQGFEDFGFSGRSRYVANHACVFMVRGLTANWKQPFGFVFSSGPIKVVLLKDLLLESISELESVGLCVKAVICDQGSNNMAVTKSLGVSPASPFFVHNERKYFVVFDPPHLIKNVRNNLSKNGLQCGDVQVSWKYVEDFYQLDCKTPVRMAPKLTEKHIKLPPFAALSVKLATQVMSHSVAAGISTMSALGALPAEAQHTANFIDRFDKLFNSMNSYNVKSNKPYQHALTPTSSHHTFLQDSLAWLETIAGTKIKKLPCIEGWKTSVSAALQLLEDLSANHEVKFLLTSRLNQDCIENLFSTVRGKGGHRDNPDVGQFISALQQIMVDSLMVASCQKNCKDDLDSFLFGFQNITSIPPPPPNVQSQLNLDGNIPEENIQVPSLQQVQEANVLAYIAGYICHKISPQLCTGCANSLCTTSDHQNHLFVQLKKYSSASALVTPSVYVMTLCQQLEEVYKSVCEEVLHKDSVKQRLTALMINKVTVPIPECGQCNIVSLFSRLFITVRLHHSLRITNQSFCKTNMKRNRKILKLTHI